MISNISQYATDIVKLENQKRENKYDLGSLAVLDRQNLNNEVDDSPGIFRVDGFRPEDDSIIIISNDQFPNFVSEAVEKAKAAAKNLEHRLRNHVLSPTITGHCGLHSYAFWPRHMAISDNRILKRFQILTVYQRTFQWLCDVAKTTQASVEPGEELTRQYTDPLTFLINQEYVPDAIKGIASDTLAALEDNSFHPVSILQHGDFWYGNILLEKSWPFPLNSPRSFFIIDWGGANIHGYPYVDQLRYLMSVGKRDKAIAHYLNLYSNRSDLSIEDILSYVCTYAGYLGMNRNEFPLDRYLKLIDSLLLRASFIKTSSQQGVSLP